MKSCLGRLADTPPPAEKKLFAVEPGIRAALPHGPSSESSRGPCPRPGGTPLAIPKPESSQPGKQPLLSSNTRPITQGKIAESPNPADFDNERVTPGPQPVINCLSQERPPVGSQDPALTEASKEGKVRVRGPGVLLCNLESHLTSVCPSGKWGDAAKRLCGLTWGVEPAG